MFICCNSPLVTKKLTGVGKGNVTRKWINSKALMINVKAQLLERDAIYVESLLAYYW